MRFQLRYGQVQVRILPHLERRHHVECELRDHPKPAEPDHRALELLAVGRDQPQRGDGGGQVAIAVTRAVRGRGVRARDGSMLKEWREPSTRNLCWRRTSSCTCATVSGACSLAAL